jgi:hypothetical protein
MKRSLNLLISLWIVGAFGMLVAVLADDHRPLAITPAAEWVATPQAATYQWRAYPCEDTLCVAEHIVQERGLMHFAIFSTAHPKWQVIVIARDQTNAAPDPDLCTDVFTSGEAAFSEYSDIRQREPTRLPVIATMDDGMTVVAYFKVPLLTLRRGVRP